VDDNEVSCRACRLGKTACDRKLRFLFESTRNEFFPSMDLFYAVFKVKNKKQARTFQKTANKRRKAALPYSKRLAINISSTTQGLQTRLNNRMLHRFIGPTCADHPAMWSPLRYCERAMLLMIFPPYIFPPCPSHRHRLYSFNKYDTLLQWSTTDDHPDQVKANAGQHLFILRRHRGTVRASSVSSNDKRSHRYLSFPRTQDIRHVGDTGVKIEVDVASVEGGN
jgi:hypothetical protein